ncbi:hypothetical protein K9B35_00990 [Sphingomonas sp. R647]|uniref:hypothetical protein n=1 Tax=Sphingomonas sp. R647 TaxID=2875233 RepID=UPI001CD215D4|nr:hypothetical protein [Sphingomonas sp. R647]MCA1196533.1 hypothetical protein [Sphingomonas sp. R647]
MIDWKNERGERRRRPDRSVLARAALRGGRFFVARAAVLTTECERRELATRILYANLALAGRIGLDARNSERFRRAVVAAEPVDDQRAEITGRLKMLNRRDERRNGGLNAPGI